VAHWPWKNPSDFGGNPGTLQYIVLNVPGGNPKQFTLGLGWD